MAGEGSEPPQGLKNWRRKSDGSLEPVPASSPIDIEQAHTESIPTTYTVYERKGTFYADSQDEELNSYKDASISTVLQNAVNAIDGKTRDVGAIYLKPGLEASIGSTVTIPDTIAAIKIFSDTSIKGAKLTGTSNLWGSPMFVCNARFAEFDSIWLNGGNRADADAPTAGILQGSGSSKPEIIYDDLWISNFDNPIEIQRGWSTTIRGCSLEFGRNAPLLISQTVESTRFIDIYGNNIHAGLDSTSWNGVNIIRVETQGSTAGVVYIHDNNLHDCGEHGMFLSGLDRSLIHHNRIYNFGRDTAGSFNGIHLGSMNGAGVRRTRIDNNFIYDGATSPNAAIKVMSQNYIGDNWVYDYSNFNSYFADLDKWAMQKLALGENYYNDDGPGVRRYSFGKVISPCFDGHILPDSSSPPTASTDYTVERRCRLTSTDSGDSNCSITVKDQQGNTIESGLSTYDNWLEEGWIINWGAFTGTDPTVEAYFA